MLPLGRDSSGSFDGGFIKRVYVATVGLSLVVVLCLLGRVEWRWIGGFMLGDALGLALLKSNEMITAKLVDRRPQRPARWLMLVQLGKYPVVGAVLYAGIVPLQFPPVAIVCGYGMTQAVILLKLAGRSLAQRQKRAESREASGVEGDGGA